ncbi:5'-nucleotidase C-terminal domain-containing protein [bacterium]|nr:5'-nucleotidase C-terminal domain-containing protein [bacterium]MBU4509618.1 5'-nucleotidase C-terminal domain-containing protein [bacterium]
MLRFKITKGLLISLLTFLLILSSVCFIFAAEKEIVILSINDFHGALAPAGKNVGGVKLVDALKTEKAKNPEGTIIVSAGDNYQGSAMSNLLYGEPVSAVFKEMGIELSAVGNHEFDWGVDRISKWAEDGGFTFVCTNIYDIRTNEPVDWAEPFVIIEKEGVKVGFVGLATPETAYKTLKANVVNYEFRDPVEVITEWVPKVKDAGADIIIALTHLGSFQDKEGNITGEAADLCEIDGVDAVISGHTHQRVSGLVNNKPLVQAYYSGRSFAKLTFTFDENDRLVSAEPFLDNLYDRADTLKDDANMLVVYKKYEDELNPVLGKVLGRTTVDLDHDRYAGPSLLGEWSCDIMKDKVGVQIAMTNGGGLRVPVPAGEITAGILYEVMPFDNTLYTMKLSGADVKANIEHGIMNDDIGWIQISGVRVTYNPNAEAGNRITSMVLEDGTTVEMDKYYTVVTNDFMFTGGDNYNFKNSKDGLDTFIPIRDALMDAVEKAGVISPKKQNWLSEEKVGKLYVVEAGDSLWEIAQKFGTTVEKILACNEIENSRLIRPGQEILIPTD